MTKIVVGGDKKMDGNLRRLYDYNKIKKFFKFARNIDIYDDHTMSYYVKKIQKN